MPSPVVSLGSYLLQLLRPGRMRKALARSAQVIRLGGLRAVHEKLQEKIWLGSGPPGPKQYARWIHLYDTPSERDHASLRARVAALSRKPLVSIVTTDRAGAEEMLREQIYPEWEVCAAPGDARGELMTEIDKGDRLPPHALALAVEKLVSDPGIDVIYSDEDLIDHDGRRSEPLFKPDWNAELARVSDYAKRLAISRTGAVRTEARVAHLPYVLYHRRIKPEFEARRIRYPLPAERPLVSVIIPTRDGGAVLERCIETLRLTSWPRLEVIVVDNQSRDPRTLRFLAGMKRVLKFDRPFNYSAINNLAVREARGELICLLNDDIEIIAPEWLEEMASHALRPEVGAVGAKLLYPDGRVQHGGVGLGLLGLAGHLHRGLPGNEPGYMGRAQLAQELSAVTAACLVIRKQTFEAMGGFDEVNLPISFNDVDLCLRIRESGLRNIFTPHAVLVHHESLSRGADDTAEKIARADREAAFMRNRWGALLEADPAYNPNLSIWTENFGIAWPPRVPRPW